MPMPSGHTRTRTTRAAHRPWFMMVVLLVVTATDLPWAAQAQALSDRDCREGGDFIYNAALSRDNGMAAAQFLERLEGDLAAIRSFSPAMRWFAYTDVEARLLRLGATAVFREPRPARQHQEHFVQICNQLRDSQAYRTMHPVEDEVMRF